MKKLNIVLSELDQMRCPYCGDNEFKIYKDKEGMIIECTLCEKGKIVGAGITIKELLDLWNIKIDEEE